MEKSGWGGWGLAEEPFSTWICFVKAPLYSFWISHQLVTSFFFSFSGAGSLGVLATHDLQCEYKFSYMAKGCQLLWIIIWKEKAIERYVSNFERMC